MEAKREPNFCSGLNHANSVSRSCSMWSNPPSATPWKWKGKRSFCAIMLAFTCRILQVHWRNWKRSTNLGKQNRSTIESIEISETSVIPALLHADASNFALHLTKTERGFARIVASRRECLLIVNLATSSTSRFSILFLISYFFIAYLDRQITEQFVLLSYRAVNVGKLGGLTNYIILIVQETHTWRKEDCLTLRPSTQPEMGDKSFDFNWDN